MRSCACCRLSMAVTSVLEPMSTLPLTRLRTWKTPIVARRSLYSRINALRSMEPHQAGAKDGPEYNRPGGSNDGSTDGRAGPRSPGLAGAPWQPAQSHGNGALRHRRAESLRRVGGYAAAAGRAAGA